MRTMVATDAEVLPAAGLFALGENVRLSEQVIFLLVLELDFGAAEFRKQHLVADLHAHRDVLSSLKTEMLLWLSYQIFSEPCLISCTRSNSNYSSFQHLRLCLLWDDNASGSLGEGLCTLDENAIEQRDQLLCNSRLKLRNKKLFLTYDLFFKPSSLKQLELHHDKAFKVQTSTYHFEMI